MERNEQYHGSENRNRNRHDQNDGGQKLENYLSRYTDSGNYYGMNDERYEYRNVRTSQGENFGNNTSGPVGGYGASSHRGAYDSGHRQQKSGRSGNRSHRGEGGRDRQNYNYGAASDETRSQGRGNQNDHYHYGDPNPYMNHDRNGGYERTRGTGWRSEPGSEQNRGNYSGQSFGGENDRYGRQDNSYRYTGEGRRYQDFGRDEGNRSKYNQEQNKGYNIGTDDSYYDRGDFSYSRSDNDYGRGRGNNSFYQGNNDRNEEDDFRYSGRIQDTDNDRNDNYATGSYASNRAYLADHDNERDRDRRSSGPDYSADSAISSFGQSDLRG